EIEVLKKRTGVEAPQYKIEVKAGDAVKITDGPFKDFDGKVSEVDEEKGKIKVLVNMFGRDTPVELDSLQIKKL
ncbi:MAG: KOW motif-containing protein, partial [Candidatus Nealsonbacteria bacterium]|nr:KOW motif-containing protein [Candidatus Nealsonbacteria bacterium]